jgi:predicted urease superfamily metal-dependent hydrolase
MARPDMTQQEEIAREAARLIETGKAASIREAIERAAEVLHYLGTPRPSVLRVRQHAQAMAMQALGEAGYAELRHEVWRIAEEMMTALEEAAPRRGDAAGIETLLVGRAAAGQIDAGVTIHIRAYTDQSTTELAEMLVELGYDEPSFDTVHTSYGPVNRLKFVDDGQEIIITRCPPRLGVSRTVDMFTGKAMTALTLAGLRQVLAAAARQR